MFLIEPTKAIWYDLNLEIQLEVGQAGSFDPAAALAGLVDTIIGQLAASDPSTVERRPDSSPAHGLSYPGNVERQGSFTMLTAGAMVAVPSPSWGSELMEPRGGLTAG